MKILLVSDSHGDDESLRRIANKHNNCDLYIHLGDSQSSPDLIRPFVSVRGNCDYYSSKFMNHLDLNSPFGKIYAEHIPYYQMNIPKLKKEGYKIYLVGHTHRRQNEIIDGIRVINPGSIKYPRDGESSYAIVEINEKSVKCEFYDLDDF